jgi:site-specific DNA-cytosine methylase
LTDYRLFFLDADQNWDVAFDQNQWLIRRKNTPRRDSKGAHSAIPRWKAKWHVGSHKRALHPFIDGTRPPLPEGQRPRIVLTPEAAFRLQSLPDRFLDFQDMAAQSTAA